MSKFLIFRIYRLSPKGMITKKVIHLYATKKLLFSKTSLFDLFDRNSSFFIILPLVKFQFFSPNTKIALSHMIAAQMFFQCRFLQIEILG